MPPKKVAPSKKPGSLLQAARDTGASGSSSKVSSPDKLRAKIEASQAPATVTVEPIPAAQFQLAPAESSDATTSAAAAASANIATAAAGSALNAKRALDSGSPSVPASSSAEAASTSEATDASSASTVVAPAGASSASASASPAKVEAAAPDPHDAALFEALKVARKAVAEQHKAMTTMVTSTEVLQSIARLRPTTMAALMEVPSFGKTRAEKFGEPLIACVEKYLTEHPEARPAAAESAEAGAPSSSAAAAAEKAPEPSAASASADVASGDVLVKYNHYKDKFRVVGGVLEFRPIDEKFALSYVFKGNFNVALQTGGAGGAQLRPNGGKLRIGVDDDGDRAAFGTFSGVLPTAEYTVLVTEDPAHVEAPKKVFTAARSSMGRGGRSGAALVTAELKKMSAAELKEGGARYRELLAQRDLEDVMGGDDNMILGEDSSGCSCIWGNPCAAPHACKDWKNRFDVATKHGWKGF